jgi:hypothetical protein
LALQYIALGHGTQNYTYLSSNSQPILLGAVATLFDTTILAYNNKPFLLSIPPIAIYIPLSPSRLDTLPFIGKTILEHHFFNNTSTPIFNLSLIDRILYRVKIANIKAPQSTNKGPAGTRAVD